MKVRGECEGQRRDVGSWQLESGVGVVQLAVVALAALPFLPVKAKGTSERRQDKELEQLELLYEAQSSSPSAMFKD